MLIIGFGPLMLIFNHVEEKLNFGHHLMVPGPNDS